MSRKINKDTMAYKNKLAYIKRYNKENTVAFSLLLNKRTDMAVITKLNELDKGNRQAYIKSLIQADIDRTR
jgi:hypothetical protein